MLSPSEHLPMAGDEVSRWMDRHRPDVVICHDSRLLEAVQATGRRVPEDVGLVHLNIAPDVAGWAGVDADLSEVAAAAVDLVFGQLSRGEYGPPKVPKIVTTPGRWTDGWTWTAKAS
jgi:LacI family transcriptional regulator